MSDNNLYLQYVDAISEQLISQKVNTRDELLEILEEIKQDYINDLESTLDEIFDDYCEENDLNWAEEE